MAEVQMSQDTSFVKGYNLLPTCKNCPHSCVTLSRPKGLEKLLTKLLFIRVYRCSSCFHRSWKVGHLFSYSFFYSATLFIALFFISSILFNSYSTVNANDTMVITTKVAVDNDTKASTDDLLLTSKIIPIENELELIEVAIDSPVVDSPVTQASIKDTNIVQDQKVADHEKSFVFESPNDENLALTFNQLIDSWATTWSNQNASQFIDFYIPEYYPKNLPNHLEWITNRKENFASKEFILVEAKILRQIINKENDIARISIEQQYESNNYSDVSIKELTFVLFGNKWKIIKEDSI